ncbi:hypothetical protein MTER_30900 [Mycolicibacter terrae]|uniref:phospholipase D n=1 Tax=Mycolicibacter terrae TaxID=1788 RepID=A0AAD1HYE7_9MYCO|nr:phospholipase D-like domain-containing protein [Mycolicibacter terrae]ORW88598.1 hypothetical protein AWC28_05185 [Mycolicibacter terrae]BBX23679.1 hypothetical protein MTER_30900 [Mycolicibacter terrae]SNV61037.1 phosphatidylserine/phosphatidylglycerophosphate/ cardiolipin synthase [Mycolicibacter terrae]
MPMWIETAGAAAPFPVSLADRRCHLANYTKDSIPSVSVRSDVIAYASPDSTYAVTKRLFDAATRSILIGIYDFSASHMKQLVLDALARGVRVSLMLDIDSAAEKRLFGELVDMGVVGVSAPSCANPSVHVFASSHEKVIVIDDEWTLVQSGNYSSNSIPLNETDGSGGAAFRTGNRDAGLAIRSPELAELFTGILTRDMARVTADAGQALGEPPDQPMILVERAPAHRPSKLFPSRVFQLDAPLTIQPVLSPDNYLDVVPALIRTATRSIVIEQQYIKADQPSVRLLLDAIAAARRQHPTLDVRIVLGKLFDRGDLPREHQNLDVLAEDYDLKLDANIRYINTDQLVHCHNKMIVIDGAAALVSSQNWSDSAVTKNREAGLWVPHPGIAQYFEAIFETDWDSAFTSPEQGLGETPVTRAALGAGGFIRVEPADYQEV